MDNKISIEQWKSICTNNLSEDEKYEVSNLGRIRSQKDKQKGIIITPTIIRGYEAINIKLATGKRTTKYLHKLIAEVFIAKNSPSESYVIHIDFNKSNNQTVNLKWATKKAMFAHQAKNPNYPKGLVRYSKLTEDDVVQLKLKLKQNNHPLSKIAQEFGITHTQLNRIRKGENWGHITID